MTLHVALAVSALAASVLLVASSQQRVLPVIALVAAAVETAVAFGYLHIAVSGLPLGLVLGLALALPGLGPRSRSLVRSDRAVPFTFLPPGRGTA